MPVLLSFFRLVLPAHKYQQQIFLCWHAFCFLTHVDNIFINNCVIGSLSKIMSGSHSLIDKMCSNRKCLS